MSVTALVVLAASLASPLAFPLASGVTAPAAAPLAAPHAAAPTDADLAASVTRSLVADARTTEESSASLRARNARHDDLALATAVSARLRAAGLAGTVVSCNDGAVTLRGRSDTEARRATAAEYAAEVPGVAAVHNLLRLPDDPRPAAELAAARDEAPPAAPAPRSTGPVRTEPFSFLTADALAGRDIVVNVVDGLVALSGTVNSDAARNYAAAAAQKVPGVRAVTSTLAIRPRNVEDDRRLALLVQRRLENSVLLKSVAGRIDVFVVDGVLRLHGTVDDAAQLDEARRVAAATSAVFAVASDLAVDPGALSVSEAHVRPFRTWRSY